MVSLNIQKQKIDKIGSKTSPRNKYQSYNKSRVSQSHSHLIIVGEKPQKFLQSDIENVNSILNRQSYKIEDQILQIQPSGGESSYVIDQQQPFIPSPRVLISNIQIDSKNKNQTPLPNQVQKNKEIISNQISLNNETSKQLRPQSQQNYKPKQLTKDKYEVKINQSFHQIEIDPVEQYQSRNDFVDHTLTQNQGKAFQIIQQNRFQPFEVDQNNQIIANTAGAIGMDGIIRINNNKTISENGDAFKQMQINNITNRKINSVKQQIQKQQLAYMSAAQSILKLNQQNIIELQKKSMELSNKSNVNGIQDSNQLNLFKNQDNYQYLDIYGKNDIQYANSRLDIGTEPQSSISYQQPIMDMNKTISKLKEQEDSKIQSQIEEISIENREKTKLLSKNQRSFTATSKSIKDKINDLNFIVEMGLPSNSEFGNENQKVDLFPNNVGAQFQNETIQDSVKSVNALEVQNINKQYYQNLNQNQQMQSQQQFDQNVENYQRIILNPLQTNFQALQQQILSDVQINGVSINQNLNLKKDSFNQLKSEIKFDKNNEQNLKFKKNRKFVQKGGLKDQKKDRYGSAMMVQHQTTYLQQAQSLARYRNLFDPMLQKNNQRLQFDQLYLVQGNSFKLISKQKGNTNQSEGQNDSKMIGTTLPNEQSSVQNIIKNNQHQNNHTTENTFQNIDTVNAADLETDNVTRVHESRYSAFSRIGSNLHNFQPDQKIPNHYFNHHQSSRDINLFPVNLINASSQRIQNLNQKEIIQQIDNNQFQNQIEKAMQNEFKNEKFNQTANARFSSTFKNKEITENNSISGGKTYNQLDQFQPIKGVQIMLNHNNYSGKTTPAIKIGYDQISGSHKSSTRKIIKDSKPVSSQQTPKHENILPVKLINQQSQLINYDLNVNEQCILQNNQIMKNVNLSKEKRKKKNDSQLRTLLSLQNVQQVRKQPSLKNAIWGNEIQGEKQINEIKQSSFLKLQSNAYGITDLDFNYAEQQNQRTNSTFNKSKQEISSNILQTTNYDIKTDQSNQNINEYKQIFEDIESAQESQAQIKKKIKKHDQNALNQKWMTKFFRKREQIQSASANQKIKRKKNSVILDNLLKSNVKNKNQQQKQLNNNQTQTSFKKTQIDQQQNNIISIDQNKQNDLNQNVDQQNFMSQNKIISNIVTKEIILSAQKEIVEQTKESQETTIKRDLYSPYNIKSQKARKNYQFIQQINDQQQIIQQEESQGQEQIIEEQKEIESIVNILKKQNNKNEGKILKSQKIDQKAKLGMADTKQQQITRKQYQQERENELLQQINLYQNIQQYNIKSQKNINLHDQNSLKYYQQNNESHNTLIRNLNETNKSTNIIRQTPQKQHKSSLANDSSINIKASADISLSKSQILQKSKKSNGAEKRMTIYQKQEIEFQKIYKQKIEELRAMPDGLFEQRKSFDYTKSVEKQTEMSKNNDQTQNDQQNNLYGKQIQIEEYDAKNFKLKDYNLYQERNTHQNILSTRMITLCKYLKQSIHSRQFLHKDQIFQIDPIRQKIRVMPQNRVPLQQGISPEYYFIQATKHCLRNNLPLAIQSLHKGFAINSNNLYCRITHGVLMFKLGLYSQAKHDFEIVVQKYPKEPFCHYNYALTLLQMGELREALTAIDIITKKKSDLQKADFELLQDAHTLQAICLWRTNCPLEAVKSLNIAQRFKSKLKEKVVVKQLTSKQLQDILNDYTLKDMQQDILQDKYIFDSVRSQSQKIQAHYSQFLQNREFSFNAQKDISFNQAQSNLFLKENQTINKERDEQNQEIKDNYIDIIEGYEKNVRQLSAGPVEYQKLFANSFQNMSSNQQIQDDFPSNIKKQLSNTSQQLKQKLINKMSRTQQINQADITFQQIQNQPNEILISIQKKESNIISANLSKFPIQVQQQYQILKNDFIQNKKYFDKNQKSKEQKLQEIIFNQKLEQFYNLLREYQIKLIDNGKQVSIEKIKEEFLRQLYESNSTTDGGHLKDYINIDLQNSHTSLQYIDQQSAATDIINNQSQTQFNSKSNQIISQNLRNKIIDGTVFTKNGIVEINNDQRELELMMIELQNKFKNISEDFFSELDRDDLKIFQKELKDEDIGDYKNITIGKNTQQNQGMTNRDQLLYGNDKIMKKLRENLNTENNLPFDLCNILKQDIEEKGKQRQIEQQIKKNQQKRIENRKLMMIKHEFHKYKGQNRHVQILDLIIGNLKFFQRFNEEQRKSVYENAEYISFPARTVIFKQGDLGDKMYVILKGRVAVEKTSYETGNLPLVVAILEDGQHFGELSLIDQEKVVNNTKKTHILDPTTFDEQPKFQGRKASCITTEQTDLLILDQELSMKLYQPTVQREASSNSEKFIIQDKESENTEMKNDELSRKIRILQKIPYFNDVDPKNLMPIAANIVPKSYSFGEFLVKRGEVPQGLFIIIKGQCKVVATRFGIRRLVSKQNESNDVQNQKKNYKKLGVVDKTINQFNPETSILNQVKTNHRAYQNERVLIDENGKEIKDRIEYQDFMAFSQLTQGNVFGGRILIPFEHYQSIQRICFGMNAMDRYYPIGCNKEEIDNESEEFYHMKSLLSIVADSAKVDVWIIEKQDMNYLQDKDLKLIYEKIVRMKEEDRPYHEQDINFIIDQFQKWDKYKIDCIEALFDRKIMEKWFKGKA